MSNRQAPPDLSVVQSAQHIAARIQTHIKHHDIRYSSGESEVLVGRDRHVVCFSRGKARVSLGVGVPWQRRAIERSWEGDPALT